MRLPLGLILTVFTSLGVVLSTTAAPKPLRLHALRAQGPTTTNSSVSSTSTSSASTSTSLASSTSSTTSTPSTSISTSSPSSQSSPPSFSTSSSSTSTTTQQFSSSQELSSTSQSTQLSSSTSTPATSVIPSTSIFSPTAFTVTGSDGSVTVTAVISSPSGGSGSGGIGTAKQGFFANTGAVAGTFLVVGLVGTGIFICVMLWALRRYRRHRNGQVYFGDEYREFNEHADRGATPEPTLPIAQDSPLGTPVSQSPVPNMIERLHGNEATRFNVYHDPAQYQAHPDEFDPYQDHGGGAYAYTDELGNGQKGSLPFAYQPEFESNGTTEPQATAGLSHTPQDAVN